MADIFSFVNFWETDAVDSKTAMAGLRWMLGPLVVSCLDAEGGDVEADIPRLLYTTDKAIGTFSVQCIRTSLS
ncbi:MAG: hypothetical protein IPH21_18585 [Flavobacteriales bacterium]|nr:hypothetical protein [Flavobacteriales bacterium]